MPMLNITDFTAARRPDGTVLVQAHIVSYLPPLFPFWVKLSLSGGQVKTVTKWSLPPWGKGELVSAIFSDVGDMFAYIEAAAPANIVKVEQQLAIGQASNVGQLQLSNLRWTPNPAYENDNVIINFEVANNSSQAIQAEIIVQVANHVERQTWTWQPDETRTLYFGYHPIHEDIPEPAIAFHNVLVTIGPDAGPALTGVMEITMYTPM
jgi:hypothetical protein